MTSINIVRGKYDDMDHHEALPGAAKTSPSGDIKDTIAIECKKIVMTFKFISIMYRSDFLPPHNELVQQVF